MDNIPEIQRSNMTIVIIGNDEKLISNLQIIAKELPDAHINLLIENEQFIPQEFNLKNGHHSLAPSMFSQINSADFKNKTLITPNDGKLCYDALIVFPLLTPSIKIQKHLKNVYYPPFEIFKQLDFHFQNIKPSILFVADSHDDCQQLTLLKQNFTIKQCKSEDITELHVFENIITSVTMRDKCVYPVDSVLVSSMKYDFPLFIHQSSYTQAQMELMDVYIMDQNVDTKLLQIFNKLKPSGKVLCLKNMELLPECEYLDQPKGKRVCHCHDICKIQNIDLPLFSSYFTKTMESKLAHDHKPEPAENMIYFDKTEEFQSMLQWIVKANLALKRRIHMNAIDIPFLPPPELSYFGAPSYIPPKDTIKESLKWIIDANLFALKELATKKHIQQRTFTVGISSIPDDKPFILYYGSYTSQIQKIYQTHKEALCDINIYTMGCSGLELSLFYGWNYLASYLEQEYCFNHPNCCGIIFDNPCLMSMSPKLIENRKVPLLETYLIKDDKDYLGFFENCQNNLKEIQNPPTTKYERKVLLDQCSDQDIEDFDKWILVPSCSGNWTNSSFLQHIKEYQEQSYAFFACGCSLTTLMNASYYSEYLPASQKRFFFGNGSFASIQEIAQKVSSKKVKVLLDGMIKIDALIDALTLKVKFNFPIISHDHEVLLQLKCLEPYLQE